MITHNEGVKAQGGKGCWYYDAPNMAGLGIKNVKTVREAAEDH